MYSLDVFAHESNTGYNTEYLIRRSEAMSVRHALLALLSEGPKYGLQLQQEFESRTGEVWPLNVGQVYTTLQRLERDGLVEAVDGEHDGPQRGSRITSAGGDELAEWLRTPPEDGPAAARRDRHQGAGGADGARCRRARGHSGPPEAPDRGRCSDTRTSKPASRSRTWVCCSSSMPNSSGWKGAVRWLDAADTRLKKGAANPSRGAAARATQERTGP